jgi:hypothetical protein
MTTVGVIGAGLAVLVVVLVVVANCGTLGVVTTGVGTGIGAGVVGAAGGVAERVVAVSPSGGKCAPVAVGGPISNELGCSSGSSLTLNSTGLVMLFK